MHFVDRSLTWGWGHTERAAQKGAEYQLLAVGGAGENPPWPQDTPAVAAAPLVTLLHNPGEIPAWWGEDRKDLTRQPISKGSGAQ